MKARAKALRTDLNEQCVVKSEVLEDYSAKLVETMGIMANEIIKTKTIAKRHGSKHKSAKKREDMSSSSSFSSESEDDSEE